MTAILPQEYHTLTSYAQKLESDSYQIATSRAEYYELLAKKTYNTKKELDKKRENSLTSNNASSLDELDSLANLKDLLQTHGKTVFSKQLILLI